MRTDTGGLLLCASAGLVAPAAAQLSEEAVRAGFAEARAAVAEHTGRALDPALELRLVDAAELGKAVADENLPRIRLGQPDEAKAAAEAELLGRQFASLAYAKYAWSAKSFLVALDTWNFQADVLGFDELVEDEVVRAVLVHELVHALDDAAFDLGACVTRCTTVDVAMGFNAVVEGHAQHVARAVCAKAGWSAGFESFTAHIGAIPQGLDEASRELARAQNATLASAYLDGERFVAALEESGGAELVARAFREPPDAVTILNPEWFVDPTLRPITRHDPEPALDRFAREFPAETWSATRLSLTSVQVGAGLGMLPQETVQSIQATLRAARLLMLQPTAAPGSRLAVVAVLEFDSPASAAAYVAAARELGRIKDERMKTGVNRILSASYGEVEAGDGRGFIAEKRMKSGAQELDVASIDLQLGAIVVETVLSVEPLERAAHVELAQATLAAVRAR